MPRPDSQGEGDALAALLLALDPDRDRAALRFEELRGRLCRFFRWRGARWPDELADATLDRAGHRLATGVTLLAADASRFVLGVARNVLMETWRHDRRHPPGEELGTSAERVVAPARSEGGDAGLECLEQCLSALPDGERDVLRRYYSGEGASRIAGRRALATELGLAAGALRIRLHRLRLRLEECVRGCLQARETAPPRRPPASRGSRS